MALEELIARLTHDADVRIAAIRARAEAEATTLLDDARSARARARDDARASKRASRRARMELELAQARRRAREARLSAAHALIERVLAAAAARFDALERDPRLVEIMIEAARDALRFVDGPSVVRARPPIAAALQRAELGPGCVVEPDPSVPAGLVVHARDGALTLDETLPARLARARPRLAIALLAKIERPAAAEEAAP
jgi:vacuolar-type H+-ATPase subunit E/Vma4